MGCAPSKHDDALAAIPAEERGDILQVFQSLATSAGPDAEADLLKLKTRFAFIPERFIRALSAFFSVVAAETLAQAGGKRQRPVVNEGAFATAAYRLTRGNAADKEALFSTYRQANADVAMAAHDFVEDLSIIAIAFYSGTQGAFRVSKRFVDHVIVFRLNAREDARPPDLTGSLGSWFDASPYLNSLWATAMDRLFLAQTTKGSREAEVRAKLLKRPLMENGTTKLLAFEDMWLLDFHLPPEQRTRSWKLAFSTTNHGMSWTVFASNIESRGSTFVLFRDKNGYVFGGFASQEWKPTPKFYGDSKCFIFRLQPDIVIYPATGYNDNYQWFEYATQSLPNGLGMGGQMDFFALWISAANFYKGHSKGNPSTTFNSYPLTKDLDFELEFVEAWVVKEKEVDPNLLPEKSNKRSILDTNIEDSAILEMSGRKMYSKDVKEAPDLVADVREDESAFHS
ncbi:TLD-domain-containing protein [Hyaloraphidium curvatum]|nr:TLD-domain-containing protein [Hyaloraphidium curvatum]